MSARTVCLYMSRIVPTARVPKTVFVVGHVCKVISHKDGFVEDDYARGLITRQLTVEVPEEARAALEKVSKRRMDDAIADMQAEMDLQSWIAGRGALG